MKLASRFLDEFKLNYALQMDQARCELFLDKYDSVCEKLKSIYYEFTADTYSCERIEALKCIRNQIDTQKKKLIEELERNKSQKKMYKSIGSEFEEIHSNYVELLKELDNRKNVLQQIRRNFE